jgi:hypothetical protein
MSLDSYEIELEQMKTKLREVNIACDTKLKEYHDITTEMNIQQFHITNLKKRIDNIKRARILDASDQQLVQAFSESEKAVLLGLPLDVDVDDVMRKILDLKARYSNWELCKIELYITRRLKYCFKNSEDEWFTYETKKKY